MFRKFSAWVFGTIKYYLTGLYHRTFEHHIFLFGGGLAFSMFVCAIPLSLILFSVLGTIFGRPSIAQEIHTFIERAIPYESYAEYINQAIFSRVEHFKLFKNITGVLGVIGLVVASSSLFSSMRTILDTAYKVPEDEPILMGKVRDLGLLALVIIYFLLSTTILPAWEILSEMANSVALLRAIRFALVEDIFLGGVAFLLIWMVFYIVYFLVPYVRQPKKVILVSSLSAALLWEIAKQIYGFYIAKIATLNMIYGAYALVVVSAFWIYFTAIVFILGAEIGQLYAERPAPIPEIASREELSEPE
ncbi:MAG: YihY/virulence factor BrkB family protein [bacterium]|nr:YihY/virulence factor BrkB family protein [bacterium]